MNPKELFLARSPAGSVTHKLDQDIIEAFDKAGIGNHPVVDRMLLLLGTAGASLSDIRRAKAAAYKLLREAQGKQSEVIHDSQYLTSPFQEKGMTEKYFVAAEIPADTAIENVASSLQIAFDNGAAGYFQVLVTMSSTYLVVFERDTADDAEYVQTRLRQGAESLELAIMQQIAAELDDGIVGAHAIPLKVVLQEGDAQCFDFGSGSIAGMDLNLPADLEPVRSSDGLKSISDDDLCATCERCQYRPGEMSSCQANWPGLVDGDGYVQKCIQFIVAK